MVTRGSRWLTEAPTVGIDRMPNNNDCTVKALICNIRRWRRSQVKLFSHHRQSPVTRILLQETCHFLRGTGCCSAAYQIHLQCTTQQTAVGREGPVRGSTHELEVRLPTYVGQLLCEGDDKTNCFEGDDLQNNEGGKKEKLGPRKTLSKDEGRGLKLF